MSCDVGVGCVLYVKSRYSLIFVMNINLLNMTKKKLDGAQFFLWTQQFYVYQITLTRNAWGQNFYYDLIIVCKLFFIFPFGSKFVMKINNFWLSFVRKSIKVTFNLYKLHGEEKPENYDKQKQI